MKKIYKTPSKLSAILQLNKYRKNFLKLLSTKHETLNDEEKQLLNYIYNDLLEKENSKPNSSKIDIKKFWENLVNEYGEKIY